MGGADLSLPSHHAVVSGVHRVWLLMSRELSGSMLDVGHCQEDTRTKNF